VNLEIKILKSFYKNEEIRSDKEICKSKTYVEITSRIEKRRD
jgi:hypothetical protein